MSSLGDKIRRARMEQVDVAGFTFTIRRPTDVEILELRTTGAQTVDMAARFVVGWDKVRGIDLYPGGDDAPVAFDADAWAEWCKDRPDFWAPLSDAVVAAYKRFVERREAAVKN